MATSTVPLNKPLHPLHVLFSYGSWVLLEHIPLFISDGMGTSSLMASKNSRGQTLSRRSLLSSPFPENSMGWNCACLLWCAHAQVHRHCLRSGPYSLLSMPPHHMYMFSTPPPHYTHVNSWTCLPWPGAGWPAHPSG